VKHVIVTGSDGSLGRSIVKSLRHKRPEYKRIRIQRHADTFFKNSAKNEDEVTYVGDLTDSSFVASVLSLYDNATIIHCAAKWNGINRDTSILENNTVSTLNLVNHLRDDIKRFVLVSSSGVYGDEVDEATPLRVPPNSYGLSKYVSEKLVLAYASYLGYEFTIWRPFHLVSPYEKVGTDGTHVCTNLAYQLVEQGQTLRLPPHCWKKTIPLTWVVDVADFLVEHLSSTQTRNRVFNIGNAELVSVNEVAIGIVRRAENLGLINAGTMDRCTDNRTCTNPLIVNWFERAVQEAGWNARIPPITIIDKFLEKRYGASSDRSFSH